MYGTGPIHELMFTHVSYGPAKYLSFDSTNLFNNCVFCGDSFTCTFILAKPQMIHNLFALALYYYFSF